MESEINQLVEMGATRAQARAALKQAKNDVMQAAEMIFSGDFADVEDHESSGRKEEAAQRKPPRPMTPHEDDDDDEEGGDPVDSGEDDNENDYGEDYDSDYEAKHQGKASANGAQAVDPYAGIFFSKTRREEVVEVDEEPEYAYVTATTGIVNPITGAATPSVTKTQLLLLSQADFMRGCPEASEQSHLFSLYNKLSEPARRCPNWQTCGGQIKINKSDFVAIHSTFEAYTAALRQTVVKACPKCSTTVCTACGESVTLPSLTAPQPSHIAPYNALFHCSDLQGIILGMGLYMIDTLFTSWRKSAVKDEAENKEEPVTKKRRTMILEPDNLLTTLPPALTGVSAPSKKKSGIGYDGAVREDMSGQNEAQRNQSVRDSQLGLLMSQVRVYLPSLQRFCGSYSSDYLVSPTALAHLRRRFNSVASSLLRNDSLADMSERSVLYFELFEWLQTVSNHEALASMVAMPIMIPSKSTEVSATASQSRSKRSRQRLVVYEGSSGPRELMESLVIQATAAIKGLEGATGSRVDEDVKEMTEEQKRVLTVAPAGSDGKGKAKERPVNDENMKLLQFCERILSTVRAIDRSLRETKGDAFVERLHTSLPKQPSSSRKSTSGPIESSSSSTAQASLSSLPGPQIPLNAAEGDLVKVYEDWATSVRFEYCDLTVKPLPTDKPREGVIEDDTPSYMSVFSSEARMLVHADIPKRSLAIAKELAVLTTNLPIAWGSSIFLRVDETRVDVIKALITGPEGTPYHNGCYLFDIFLGPNYNTSPPSVKYMTTNGGKFRFNPNLYAEGKVCLSLLGTWSGPGWVAGRSTLLQVLISIQSMILCDEPYLNEPGWASGAGTPASQAYSANVRRMVVHTAMIGNLKNPPEPFRDIILTHFRLKAKSIVKQLDEWLTLDDGQPTNGTGAAYVSSNAPLQAASGAGSGFRGQVDEMKRLLTMLIKGEDPTAYGREVGGSGAPVPDAWEAPVPAEMEMEGLEYD